MYTNCTELGGNWTYVGSLSSWLASQREQVRIVQKFQNPLHYLLSLLDITSPELRDQFCHLQSFVTSWIQLIKPACQWNSPNAQNRANLIEKKYLVLAPIKSKTERMRCIQLSNMPKVNFFSLNKKALLSGNKHLDNMANCPAKAAYGFMDLDTRTAKWEK